MLVSMGQVNLKIDDELERAFRQAAAEKFGARKGFLQKAVEEAVRDWINKNRKGRQDV